jgi:hypothetical protein
LSSPTYRGFVPLPIEISDRRFYVGVHLALVDERLICVGVDLRAVNFGGLAGQAMDLGNGDWAEITTSILRGLPLGEVVERALAEHRLVIEGTPESTQAPRVTAAGSSAPAARPAARGPRPLLDDVALSDIVGRAYRLGGRRPVQAVQEALERADVLPGPVTIDQARRAVVRARARGFLQPAKASRIDDDEEQP